MDWNWLTKLLRDEALVRDIVATAALLLVALVVRAALLKLVRRTSWADEATRGRWRMQVRNTAMVLTALGLFLIWSSELRTLALSLVAVAVALVIATKELILCVMGAIVRASSHSFTVGDRIEIGDVRGDVIDAGLFATQLLETGPAHQRTGRAIVVPNSTFLVSPITNETFTGQEHVLHIVTVPVTLDAGWAQAEAALLEAARRVTEEYRDAARESLNSVAKSHHLSDQHNPDSLTDPQILLNLPAAGELKLSVRVPAPVREKGKVEQRILRHYLELTRGQAKISAISDVTELRSHSAE